VDLAWRYENARSGLCHGIDATFFAATGDRCNLCRLKPEMTAAAPPSTDAPLK
jgi:hypothetical protein